MITEHNHFSWIQFTRSHNRIFIPSTSSLTTIMLCYYLCSLTDYLCSHMTSWWLQMSWCLLGTRPSTTIILTSLCSGITLVTSQNIHIVGLVWDCSISIANALEILQSCTKPSISCYSHLINNWYFKKIRKFPNGGFLCYWWVCLLRAITLHASAMSSAVYLPGDGQDVSLQQPWILVSTDEGGSQLVSI